MKAIHESLLFLCRCLSFSHEPEHRERLRHEISSGKPAWETVVFLANHYLVTPALGSALQRKDLWDVLDEDLKQYLEEIHRLNLERNRLVKQEATRAARCLNAAGIEPVLLKGGANLFTNPYGDMGARMMIDVDMLLPEPICSEATKVLMEHGYNEMQRPEDEEDTAHGEPLFRDGAVARIELHTRLLHHNEPQVITAQDAWEKARRLTYQDVDFRVLSPEHWFVYNFVHSEIRHEHFARGLIGLRDLYDLSAVWDEIEREVDWHRVTRTMSTHGIERPFVSYLQLANRLFGIALPGDAKTTLSAEIHYARCMAQLHLSQYPLTTVLVEMWFPFSSTRIRRKYGCSNRIGELTRWRLHHIGFLARKYVFGQERRRLLGLLRRGSRR